MSCEIKNLTGRPVSVPLRSGTTLMLPPGGCAEVSEAELDDDRVRKLNELRWISMSAGKAGKLL